MYLPDVYNNCDKEKIDSFINANNFGDLVTFRDGKLSSNKCPFLYDNVNNRLYGHFGNSNAQLVDIEDSPEVLVILTGPHCYISPQWYQSEGMVPTWNFQTIQVRGKAKIVAADVLVEILESLSKLHESNLSPQWSMKELESGRLTLLQKMITGFQIDITEILFKEKMSQNRKHADQQNVINSLLEQGDPSQLDVANLMRANLDI
ncbi:MAG: FMN-binding negative transcriptional regulator [Thiohalomonadales bacterium]